MQKVPCLVYDSEIQSVYVIGGALISQLYRGLENHVSFVKMPHPTCFLQVDLLKTSLYSICDDKWRDDLSMLKNLCQFSSGCILNRVIYVIGKLTIKRGDHAPIERLDTRQLAAGWSSIDVPSEVVTRPLAGVVALKQTQKIIIFRCSSVFFLDPVSHELEEAVDCIDHAGFIYGNQVRQADDGGVYFLKYPPTHKHVGPKLLKWTMGEQKVTLIKDYLCQSDK